MKRIIFPLLFMIGIYSHSSSQELKRYELKVGEFSELKVTDGINVDYHCNADSAGVAVFSATDEMASKLMFSSRKGKLEIRISDDVPTATGLPTVKVYSTTLDKTENSGDSLVRIYSPLAPATFQAKVIGNGRLAIHNLSSTEIKASIITGRGQIVLNGSCDKANYSITGTGTIQADGMKAKDVNCRIVGTGTIGLYCTGRLSIHGAGSGKVFYTGDPAEISSGSWGIGAIKM